MILIVGSPQDEHVRRVRQHLQGPVHVLDCAEVPTQVGVEADADSATLIVEGRRVDLGDVTTVWRRRHRGYVLHPEMAGAFRQFAWSETDEALQGAMLAMECAWFNDPGADERAQRKVVQLRTAKALGLDVPTTLATSDPGAARTFVESAPGRVVRKVFRNLESAGAHTRIVTAEDLRLIDSVRFAPVIFQEYIPVELDLRVTVVDGEVFAAAIKSGPDFHADYRPGLASATVTAYQLPDDVVDQLRLLCSTLGLRYGAIDLRLTPDGRHVFLEVNPGGEFLFVSDRTEQPVAEAVAAALARDG